MAHLNDVVRLNNSHIKPASRMLARAFHNDPVLEYFYPDVTERMKKAPYVYQFLLRYVLYYGEAYTPSSQLEAVAAWLNSDKVTMSLRRLKCSGALPIMSKLCREAGSRMKYFGEHQDAVHKRLISGHHWYLQILGVEPEFQGKGYASKLLRPVLSKIDAEGATCYLETQKESNTQIYEHFGFRVIEEFTIPDTSFQNWAMIR